MKHHLGGRAYVEEEGKGIVLTDIRTVDTFSHKDIILNRIRLDPDQWTKLVEFVAAKREEAGR
jgi:hypothetical protein